MSQFRCKPLQIPSALKHRGIFYAALTLTVALFPPILEAYTDPATSLASAMKAWQSWAAAFTTLTAGILAYSGALRSAEMARQDSREPYYQAALQMAHEMHPQITDIETELCRWVEHVANLEFPRQPASRSISMVALRKALRKYTSEWQNLGYLSPQIAHNLRFTVAGTRRFEDQFNSLNKQVRKEIQHCLQTDIDELFRSLHLLIVALEKEIGAPTARATENQGQKTCDDLGLNRPLDPKDEL